MLIGEYTHTIDDKKRVSLPARFRKELGKKVVITNGFENSLSVYSPSNWKVFADKLSVLSLGRAEDRRFSRFILGSAVEVDVDTAGRVLIPDFLKDFGSLKNKVVWVGNNDHLEVWDDKKWREYKKVSQSNADVIAQKLGENGII